MCGVTGEGIGRRRVCDGDIQLSQQWSSTKEANNAIALRLQEIRHCAVLQLRFR